MTDQRLDTGVIGAGMIGRVHAQILVFRIPKGGADYHEILANHSVRLSEISQRAKGNNT